MGSPASRWFSPDETRRAQLTARLFAIAPTSLAYRYAVWRWGQGPHLTRGSLVWFTRASLQRLRGRRRTAIRLARIGLRIASAAGIPWDLEKRLSIASGRPLPLAPQHLSTMSPAVPRLLDVAAELNDPLKCDVLARFMSFCGYPLEALRLRDLACELIRRHWEEHPQHHSPLALRLFFETGDFEKVSRLIHSPDSSLAQSDRLLFTRLVSHLSPRSDLCGDPTPELSCLTEEVCGRHVALVAPGRIKENFGEFIDGADLVIRIQPYVRPDLDEPGRRGTRLDIAAFSSSVNVIHSNHSGLDLSHLSACRAIIAKKAPPASYINGQPVRSVRVWRPILFSTPISGTIMITEVLLARPRRLDLFGFNFYADPSGYTASVNSLYANPDSPLGFPMRNRSFMRESRLPPETVARAFPSHDLFSDFLFVKRLVTSGTRVYAHGDTEELLNQTVRDYAARLTEVMSSS